MGRPNANLMVTSARLMVALANLITTRPDLITKLANLHSFTFLIESNFTARARSFLRARLQLQARPCSCL
jgi:hypothetical protein